MVQLANAACSYPHTATPLHNLCCLSAADSVSVKECRKTRRSAPSGIPLSDVQSSSSWTQHHRKKTGPMRRALSTSSQRRKRITSLTLADHDASQSTLEDHNFVLRSQSTPLSTNLPSAVSPNRGERIQSRRLFPFPSGVYMCTIACMYSL